MKNYFMNYKLFIKKMRKIRLFVEKENLKSEDLIEIKDQDFNYLAKVMRVNIDDEIEIFNGENGDFSAKIIEINKKSLKILVLNKIKEQDSSNNITLAFSLVKNIGVDFIAKKGTELGVSNFQPLISKHSIPNKINYQRFNANIKEATEQCETNFVPKISELNSLNNFLQKEEIKNKILILCDESGNGKKASEFMRELKESRQNNEEIIVFIGPEGGFSQEEFEKFNKFNNLYRLSLGKRILRVDSAIISALALINEFLE